MWKIPTQADMKQITADLEAILSRWESANDQTSPAYRQAAIDLSIWCKGPGRDAVSDLAGMHGWE